MSGHRHGPQELSVAHIDKDGALAIHSSAWPAQSTMEFLESHAKGATNRIIAMVEKDQDHAHRVENAEQKLEFVTRIMGMVLAGTICVALIVSGTLLMWTDHYVTGAGSVIIAFIMIINSLAVGGKSQPSAPSEK